MCLPSKALVTNYSSEISLNNPVKQAFKFLYTTLGVALVIKDMMSLERYCCISH